MPNLRVSLTIAAVGALVFGLGFLLVPDLVLAPFGVVLDPVGGLMTRMYGAMHLGFGLIAWLSRDLDHARSRRALAVGNLVYFALAAVMSAGGLVAGVANSLILVNAVAFAALAVAFLPHAVRAEP